MQALDIIGDVHGCASQLTALLRRLGYDRHSETEPYRHPYRQAIFVGDLITRGTQELETLELVRAMVDGGSAQLIMGNKEFDAIANPEHSLGRLSPDKRAEYVEWFKTLPLWLELCDESGQPAVRVVHACWHADSMAVVRRICGSERIGSEQWPEAFWKGHNLAEAVGILLRGPVIPVKPYTYPGSGLIHGDARIRWWDAKAITLRDLADTRNALPANGGKHYPELPADPVDASSVQPYRYEVQIPLFYGHYWQDWMNRTGTCTAHTACVDFSAGFEGGILAAYRWSGEQNLSWRNYVPFDTALDCLPEV